MYDPSMRVLTVLELLQSRGNVSGRELAARLEVSQRTVQRYITRLQDLGAPVESTRGPGGAYRLKPGFRLPPLMFGTTEAFAIALGLEALSYLGLANVAPAADGAKDKLNRVLPSEARARVDAVRNALVLERPRSGVETDLALLITLAASVHDARAIQIRYRKEDGSETARGVRPYGLMRHEGRWFLAGFCLLRDDLRLFRVDRIQTARETGEPFDKPAEFDMAAFLYDRIALGHRGLVRPAAGRVRASPSPRDGGARSRGNRNQPGLHRNQSGRACLVVAANRTGAGDSEAA